MARILCVDDEPAVGVVLENLLTRLGHRPLLAESVPQAMRTVSSTPIDLIISDYRMPGATGADLLRDLDEGAFEVPVIMMTGHGSIEHAVVSIRNGAADYLVKPVKMRQLDVSINHVLESASMRRQSKTIPLRVVDLVCNREMVGDSVAMRNVMQAIAAVAPTGATVLLQGESGTGKELAARAIHDLSPRRDQPFISLNCAAMPESLVESTLFGHEKGAFTGAIVRTSGAFERANGGTLLLDEISEMQLHLQAKLLRVLEERAFERVGGKQMIRVNVRVVATTNRDLWCEVEAGRFREDLYYRINVVPITLPPLRERCEDIPSLVHYFAGASAKELGLPARAIADDSFAKLQAYRWPGNIRELANTVKRAMILSHGKVLRVERFLSAKTVPAPDAATHVNVSSAEWVSPAQASGSTDEATYNLRELEKIMICRALGATGGRRTKAARLLGISERTLRNKLKAERTVA